MGGVRQAPPVRLWRGALLRVVFGRFVFGGFTRVLDLDHFSAGPDKSVFAADCAGIDMNRHLRRLGLSGGVQFKVFSCRDLFYWPHFVLHGSGISDWAILNEWVLIDEGKRPQQTLLVWFWQETKKMPLGSRKSAERQPLGCGGPKQESIFPKALSGMRCRLGAL